jgi:acyl carrier protein
VSDPKTVIKTFIVDNFLFGKADGLSDRTSFLEEGLIDSTGILELVTFLEKRFGIQVEDDVLVPENLDSLENLAAYLARKSGGVSPAP